MFSVLSTSGRIMGRASRKDRKGRNQKHKKLGTKSFWSVSNKSARVCCLRGGWLTVEAIRSGR